MGEIMAAGTSGTSKFRITVIPADDDGCRFYLEQYKPFRLASLQQDAHAFGSTYAREIGFDDATWLGRIRDPMVTTLVAVQADNNRVAASTSLIGPLPNADPASNPYQAVSEAIAGGVTTNASGEEPLHFQMSAVYTSPEARGQGLAKALIKAATAEARNRARRQGRPLVLSVVVYAANSAAISVYERCGFATGAAGPKLVFNAFKNSSVEELNMYFQGEL